MGSGRRELRIVAPRSVVKGTDPTIATAGNRKLYGHNIVTVLEAAEMLWSVLHYVVREMQVVCIVVSFQYVRDAGN